MRRGCSIVEMRQLAKLDTRVQSSPPADLSSILRHQIYNINPSNKEFTINKIRELRWSILEKELLKCKLLCRNCHAEPQVNVNSSQYHKRLRLLQYKGIFSCEKCGYIGSNYGSLDFHHRYGKDNKKFGLNEYISKRSGCRYIPLCEALVELEKCSVICRNCHALEHIDINRFNKFRDLIYNRAVTHKECQPPANKEIVFTMYKDGLCGAEIARKLGYSKSTICSILKTSST